MASWKVTFMVVCWSSAGGRRLQKTTEQIQGNSNQDEEAALKRPMLHAEIKLQDPFQALASLLLAVTPAAYNLPFAEVGRSHVLAVNSIGKTMTSLHQNQHQVCTCARMSVESSDPPAATATTPNVAGVLLVTGAGPESPFRGRTQVAFSIMDTVVHDPFREVALEFFGMTEADLMQAQNESAWVAFERGDIDETQFQATLFKDGRDFDLKGLKAALVAGYEFIDGMPELLQDLQAAGHKLHGFTNYPEWYILIEEKLGLEATHGLQWTCMSCDTGLRKPEPAAFLNLLKRLGAHRKVGAAPILFVDDSAENCDSAAKAGISSVHFTDAVQLRKTLGDLLGSRKRGTAPPEGWPERVMR